MKNRKILILLTALLLLLSTPTIAYADSDGAPENTEALEGGRNIYVGDIVTLEIAVGGISTEELREKFSDFEIVELREAGGLYLLSLRTFETGAYTVPLGDKEIVITVASTLDDIDREGIFEGGAQVIKPGILFHWRIFFFISAGVFILSGGYILLKIIAKKKVKALPPYRLFLRRCSGLDFESDSCLVELTRYFKEYIESLYQCRIIGKTSSEIANELREIEPLHAALSDIGEWLDECDRLKFTGIRADGVKKWELNNALLDLAEKIDRQKVDARKVGAA